MAIILIWENDPGAGGFAIADQPDIKKPPFKFGFPPPALLPSLDTTTEDFRYWIAAEALRRGADFWGPKVTARPTWYCGTELEVRLDVGPRWDANYERLALNFFHGVLSSGVNIYAAASGDMLCHELGHAMLDAIQDRLWHTVYKEVDAFHELFGDVSAILCALQIPTMRRSILTYTGPNLYRDSKLSRIAEQFGAGLHAQDPAEAYPNCLRNAWNSFYYVRPDLLPGWAHITQLSSERHSFSRIFTGALFEILAGMLTVHAANSLAPTPAELLDVTMDMRDIMAAAVVSAPIDTGYYALVAAEMVLASETKNPAYPAVFCTAFVGRLIFSLASASAIMEMLTTGPNAGARRAPTRSRTANIKPGHQSYTPVFSPLPSERFGLGEDLYVEMPADAVDSSARSATREGNSIEPLNSEAAATLFVDELFALGLVDTDADRDDDDGKKNEERVLERTTHRLKRVGKQLRLMRIQISCRSEHACSWA